MTYTKKGYTQTEIIEALHMIQDICDDQAECKDCPFANRFEECQLQHTSPMYWGIKEMVEIKWRAFE